MFKSYLSIRTQTVLMNNILDGIIKMCHGFFRETVLYLILFNGLFNA